MHMCLVSRVDLSQIAKVVTGIKFFPTKGTVTVLAGFLVSDSFAKPINSQDFFGAKLLSFGEVPKMLKLDEDGLRFYQRHVVSTSRAKVSIVAGGRPNFAEVGASGTEAIEVAEEKEQGQEDEKEVEIRAGCGEEDVIEDVVDPCFRALGREPSVSDKRLLLSQGISTRVFAKLHWYKSSPITEYRANLVQRAWASTGLTRVYSLVRAWLLQLAQHAGLYSFWGPGRPSLILVSLQCPQVESSAGSCVARRDLRASRWSQPCRTAPHLPRAARSEPVKGGDRVSNGRLDRGRDRV
ncbi:hypothetical protein VNO78_07476 [Psophocarpus tetragonolobus]|uniref:Uncharacterized protein n=1 Tax=Psophocarpus tetragonolobus TaxID=3891 RepID=A0AAN9STH9_PSOTE